MNWTIRVAFKKNTDECFSLERIFLFSSHYHHALFLYLHLDRLGMQQATWDWVEILIDSTYKILCFVYDEGKLNHFRMEAYFLTKELSQ